MYMMDVVIKLPDQAMLDVLVLYMFVLFNLVCSTSTGSSDVGSR
jgi:hypothetical protein